MRSTANCSDLKDEIEGEAYFTLYRSISLSKMYICFNTFCEQSSMVDMWIYFSCTLPMQVKSCRLVKAQAKAILTELRKQNAS